MPPGGAVSVTVLLRNPVASGNCNLDTNTIIYINFKWLTRTIFLYHRQV